MAVATRKNRIINISILTFYGIGNESLILFKKLNDEK
jgi:hypothetical protein